VNPPPAPFRTLHLAVGDGHRLHVELWGNPRGRPVLVLHGGPGSGLSASTRRYFDPERWCLVQFDQRGCGRSTPHAASTLDALSANTTDHLLADIETLRAELGIDRWLVLGSSWGTTLALAHAQRNPARVTGLLLRAVTTTTRREIGWITRGVGAFLPEPFQRFRDHLPPALRDGDLADGYASLLADPDPAVAQAAARAWCDWEAALVALDPALPPDQRWDDAQFRLGFARLVTHFWRHAAWLPEDHLLHGMKTLAGVPGTLIHGRLDLGSPLGTAWALHQAWPGSRLVLLENAGHDARDHGMAQAMAAAVARCAQG